MVMEKAQETPQSSEKVKAEKPFPEVTIGTAKKYKELARRLSRVRHRLG